MRSIESRPGLFHLGSVAVLMKADSLHESSLVRVTLFLSGPTSKTITLLETPSLRESSTAILAMFRKESAEVKVMLGVMLRNGPRAPREDAVKKLICKKTRSRLKESAGLY